MPRPSRSPLLRGGGTRENADRSDRGVAGSGGGGVKRYPPRARLSSSRRENPIEDGTENEGRGRGGIDTVFKRYGQQKPSSIRSREARGVPTRALVCRMGYRAFARGQGGSPGLLSRSLRPARSGKPVQLLNTAEGNGKWQGRQRAKFFEDARGSAAECAACLDVLVAKRILAAERIDEGKAMLLRIVSMLSKRGEGFDNSYDRLRE